MSRISILIIMPFLFVLQSLAAQEHGNRADYVEYGPLGKYIAVAGDDLLLMNRTGNEIRLVNEAAPEARVVSFSPDGKLLAAESKNFVIYIYSVEDKNQKPLSFQGIKKGKNLQSRLIFNSDNTMLATNDHMQIVIYSLVGKNTGKVVLRIPRLTSNVHTSTAALVATPDWKYFFHNMQLIELSKDEKGVLSYKYDIALDWNRMRTSHYAIAPDASKVAVSARGGLDQAVFDLKTGAQILLNTNLVTHDLTANKDFSKLYMSQATWDLKSTKMKMIYQSSIGNEGGSKHISVANDNGEFSLGLSRYSAGGRRLG
ncbi:MAG: hypothetical protein HRT88_17200, partial [Lentisphaeraceae bacterium]|nr:hypothetical protein [Lentisphaeraceae bacterium]